MPLPHFKHNSGTGVGPLFKKESMGDTQLPLIIASLTFYRENSVKCPFLGGKKCSLIRPQFYLSGSVLCLLFSITRGSTR